MSASSARNTRKLSHQCSVDALPHRSVAGSLAYNRRDLTHTMSMVAIWKASLPDLAKVTFIQFADVIGGTGRLSTLYVELDGMKLPAMFCRWAVYSCAGDVALTRQSATHL